MRVILSPDSKTDVSGYAPGARTLFKCDATLASFSVALPDADGVNSSEFLFYKTNPANTVTITAQFGQTISGAQSISITQQFQTIHIIADSGSFIMISGMVPELHSWSRFL